MFGYRRDGEVIQHAGGVECPIRISGSVGAVDRIDIRSGSAVLYVGVMHCRRGGRYIPDNSVAIADELYFTTRSTCHRKAGYSLRRSVVEKHGFIRCGNRESIEGIRAEYLRRLTGVDKFDTTGSGSETRVKTPAHLDRTTGGG